MIQKPHLLAGLSAPDRRGSDSNKWSRYGSDVLPLWVADMDFSAAPEISDAVAARLAHGVLGYGRPWPGLAEAIAKALHADYDWEVDPDWLIFTPGVEPALNMALRASTQPGDAMVVELPNYKALTSAAAHNKLELRAIWQSLGDDGRWHADRAAFAQAAEGAKAMLLCNPHNPTGRVLTRDELSFRADLCLKHGLTLISDEIHCGLTLDGRKHIPIASLSPEIAAQSVTLMAASKTWNIAGLKASFAVIPNADLRNAVQNAKGGLVDSTNVLGLAATEAAYAKGNAWRALVRQQLEINRDHLTQLLAAHLPQARMVPAEAGFLAWIDFSDLALPLPAAEFFLKNAAVALSCGTEFAPGLTSWARLNFGCEPDLLDAAVLRMAEAVAQV